MNRTFIISLVLGSSMLMSAGLSKVMTPTNYMSESRPKIQLESAIPAQFDGWNEEKSLASVIVNPDKEAEVNKVYAQTLSRAYVNGKGERIMLSIAYGTDQRRGNDVHYPEVCYPAQGFELMSLQQGVLTMPDGAITVNRLETNLSKQRYEPVTYWTIIGDEVTLGGSDKRMKELAFGLKGQIPDGLVFRVSSIDRDTKHAYALQDAFVISLAKALASKDKKWLMGLH